MVRVECYSANEVELGSGFTSRSREHTFSNCQNLFSTLYINVKGSECRLGACPMASCRWRLTTFDVRGTLEMTAQPG